MDKHWYSLMGWGFSWVCNLPCSIVSNNAVPGAQVHVYLPENGHPATGLVRTIVKDSTNLDTSSFLDSDGHYGDNTARNQLNSNPVDDGAWHMVCCRRAHRPPTPVLHVILCPALTASRKLCTFSTGTDGRGAEKRRAEGLWGLV